MAWFKSFNIGLSQSRLGLTNVFARGFQRVFLALVVLTAILMIGTVGYMFLEDWSPLDAVWMTVITMSTVGFAEVAPMHAQARLLTMFIIVSTILVGGYAVGNIGAFFFGGEVLNILRGRKLEKDIERLKGHIILVGYGRVGKGAASELGNSKIIVIESNPVNAAKAKDDGLITIEGDATHDETLHRAGIERARSIIIATGHVADNILITMTARQFNPEIMIASRGDEPSSEVKLKRAGADRVVLPNLTGGRRMAAFVISPSVMDFLDLVTRGDELSLRLQEIEIGSSSDLTGKTLKDSDLRKASGGALVMAVKRTDGRLVIAPSPDYEIQSGDQLIAIGTDETLAKICKMAT